MCLIYETDSLPTALRGHLCIVLYLKTGGMCTLNISLIPGEARVLVNELVELL